MLGLELKTGRRWLALVALATACGRPTPPVAAPVEPDPIPPATSTPATPLVTPLIYDEHGGLFLEASVGDDATRRFIFDTGASASTLDTDYAKSLGLRLLAGDEVTGTAGTVRTQTAEATLHVPGLDDVPIEWVVYGFGSYDPACVGIVGQQLLQRRPFAISYEERTVTWDAAPPAVAKIPMALDGGIPRIGGELEGVAMDLRIDTGATLAPTPDFYLNLAPAQAQALGLDEREPIKVFKATGTGGATLQLPVHAVADLKLGPVHVARAFAIVQPEVGYFARPEAVGFIGNSVLDKLAPHFDYANGALYLTPPDDSAD